MDRRHLWGNSFKGVEEGIEFHFLNQHHCYASFQNSSLTSLPNIKENLVIPFTNARSVNNLRFCGELAATRTVREVSLAKYEFEFDPNYVFILSGTAVFYGDHRQRLALFGKHLVYINTRATQILVQMLKIKVKDAENDGIKITFESTFRDFITEFRKLDVTSRQINGIETSLKVAFTEVFGGIALAYIPLALKDPSEHVSNLNIEQSSLWGTNFFWDGHGNGYDSLHFDSQRKCYYQTEDGTGSTKRLKFFNVTHDADAITFRGTIKLPNPLGNIMYYTFDLHFDRFFFTILKGEIIGTDSKDKVSFKQVFGVDRIYFNEKRISSGIRIYQDTPDHSDEKSEQEWGLSRGTRGNFEQRIISYLDDYGSASELKEAVRKWLRSTDPFDEACKDSTSYDILDALRPLNLSAVDENRRSILHRACANGNNEDILKYIYHLDPNAISAVDRFGFTPFQLLEGYQGFEKVIMNVICGAHTTEMTTRYENQDDMQSSLYTHSNPFRALNSFAKTRGKKVNVESRLDENNGIFKFHEVKGKDIEIITVCCVNEVVATSTKHKKEIKFWKLIDEFTSCWSLKDVHTWRPNFYDSNSNVLQSFSCMSWNKDGSLLTVGDTNGCVHILEVNIFPDNVVMIENPIFVIAHAGPIMHVSFNSTSNDVISSCSFENEVKVWKISDAEKNASAIIEQNGTNFTSNVVSVSWSFDGKTLATAVSNGDIFITYPASGKYLKKPIELRDKICSALWSPCAKGRLAVGLDNGTGFIYFVSETGVYQRIRHFKHDASYLAWTNDGERVVGCKKEGKCLTIWNMASDFPFDCIRKINNHACNFDCVQWLCDHPIVIASDTDGRMHAYNLSSSGQVEMYDYIQSRNKSVIHNISMTNGSEFPLILAVSLNSLLFYDTSSRNIRTYFFSNLTCAGISNDGKKVALCFEHKVIIREFNEFQLNSTRNLYSFKSRETYDEVISVRFSCSDQYVACLGTKKVTIYKFGNSEELIKATEVLCKDQYSFAWNIACDDFVVSTTEKNSDQEGTIISFYKQSDHGSLSLKNFDLFYTKATSRHISLLYYNSSQIYMSDNTNKIIVWYTESLTSVEEVVFEEMNVRVGNVLAIQLLDECNRLLVVRQKNPIKIYNIESDRVHRLVRSIPLHGAHMTSALADYNGSCVVTGALDGMVRILRFAIPKQSFLVEQPLPKVIKDAFLPQDIHDCEATSEQIHLDWQSTLTFKVLDIFPNILLESYREMRHENSRHWLSELIRNTDCSFITPLIEKCGINKFSLAFLDHTTHSGNDNKNVKKSAISILLEKESLSAEALDIVLKSFSFMFESRDIQHFLTTYPNARHLSDLLEVSELSKGYEKSPEIISRFIMQIKPIKTNRFVNRGLTWYSMKGNFFVRGSNDRSPVDFWRNELDDVSPSLDDVPVDAYLIPLKNIAGNHDFLRFAVEAYTNYLEKDEFDGTTIEYLISFKWEVVKRRFYQDLLTYVLYISLLTYIVVDIDKFQGSSSHLMIIGVCGLCWIYFLRHEYTSFKGNNLSIIQHIASDPLFNILDLTSLTLNLITLIFSFVSCLSVEKVGVHYITVARVIGCLAMPVGWINLLALLRGLSKAGPFIQTIKNIIPRLSYFFIVLVIFILGYAASFQVLLKIDTTNTQSLLFYLLSSFTWMLGESDFEQFENIAPDDEIHRCSNIAAPSLPTDNMKFANFNGSESEFLSITDNTTQFENCIDAPPLFFAYFPRNLGYINFVSYILFVHIILLNVLIAIVSSVYDELQQRRRKVGFATKGKLVLEYVEADYVRKSTKSRLTRNLYDTLFFCLPRSMRNWWNKRLVLNNFKKIHHKINANPKWLQVLTQKKKEESLPFDVHRNDGSNELLSKVQREEVEVKALKKDIYLEIDSMKEEISEVKHMLQLLLERLPPK